MPRKRDSYTQHRKQTAARWSTLSAEGRDIGPLPPIADPARRARCRRDFRLAAETYFPHAFTLAWSPDHLRVIAKIERATLIGGLFAVAMPRGSGKTTLTEFACLWAVLYGHCGMVALIGSTAARGEAMLESLKTEIETNELLAADFPEAVYPVRCLERINNRAAGQTYQGRPTRIEWTGDEIVFPTIAGSPSSAAVITATGLEGGSIRGQRHKTPDGKVLRPSLVVIDDPQTTESAWSELQSRRREAILAGDVLGMAGPGKKIAGILCCTVIRPGDMADAILNRDKHPEWQGERTKMLYCFPAAAGLWEQYAEIRANDLKTDGTGTLATEFYREHREEMDAGAFVAWPQRFNPDELSAVQNAMNLFYRDRAAFQAECQNEPLEEVDAAEIMLPAEKIAAKQHAYRRGIIPDAAPVLTAFIDPHKEILFYVVLASEPNATGYVVDYGTWPDQRRALFSKHAPQRPISREITGMGWEGALFAALDRLTNQLCGREWATDGGAAARVRRVLIDANWGDATDLVYRFCRQSSHAALLLPSHGKYVGANSRPMAEYRRKPGDIVGLNWRIPMVGEKRQIRHAVFDANFWKTYVHARLLTAVGDPGCLTLFKAHDHRLVASHLVAELPQRKAGSQRILIEFHQRPDGPDNDLLDCVVGAHVAAAIEGIALAQHRPQRSLANAGRRRRARVAPLKT